MHPSASPVRIACRPVALSSEYIKQSFVQSVSVFSAQIDDVGGQGSGEMWASEQVCASQCFIDA